MGSIILIILVIIEISIMFLCIKTRSNQKKSRSIIRVMTFVVFVMLTLLSVIKWGFQYVLLGAVLFIFATFGVVYLIRNKNENKEYKTSRIVVKSILTTLLLIIVTMPAIIFLQYQLPKVTGKFEVASNTYTYVDENRIETFTDEGEHRKLNMEIWYPMNVDEVYPLLVFSHGSTGVKTSNISTYIELASHGYVVCSIDHPYHAIFTKGEDGSIATASPAFVQESIDINNGVYTDEEIHQISNKNLRLRVDDMNFVIDTILDLSKTDTEDRVYKLIDTEKIGVFGHSLGGAAAIQLGRERDDIGAVINLDADMLGEYLGVENGKPIINKEIYTTPILSFWSDDMVGGMEDNSDILLPNKYISETAPEAYDVYIQGTNHFSYTELALLSPTMVKIIMGSIGRDAKTEKDPLYVIENMNEISLNFFDAFLKDEGEFILPTLDY